jgi:predicted dienelactone hydrolase
MRHRHGWLCAALLAPLLALPAGAGPPEQARGLAPDHVGSGPLDAPDELGPFAVGRATFSVVDPSRNRTLPVDVWYPVDAGDAGGPASVYDLVFTGIPSAIALDSPPVSSGGPFPLVIFSHGNQGIRYQSYFLGEHLASHGFVVAAPDHVGNTAADLLLPNPPPFQARDRPLDVSAVITRMLQKNGDPADAFFGTLHPFRIAVVGHSFGAFTALAMASGFQDVPPDLRVRAIMPISPAASALSDEELARIVAPAFVLGGTADTITPIDPQSVRSFGRISSRPRYRVDVEAAGHNSFTNICEFFEALLDAGIPQVLLELLLGNFEQGCSPDLIAIEDAHRLTNLYATAFLRRTLGLDPRYQRYLTPGFARQEPDVTFLFVAGVLACGIGAELALVVPALWWRRSQRRARPKSSSKRA